MTVTFTKTAYTDVTNTGNRDIIIPGVVELTRNQTGALYNYPGLIEKNGDLIIDSTDPEIYAGDATFANNTTIYDIFWYTDVNNALGDTTPGVKWGLENFDGFTNISQNDSLLANIVNNNNFFTFGVFVSLLRSFRVSDSLDQTSTPTTFIPEALEIWNAWTRSDGSTYSGNHHPTDMVDKNIIMYIESTQSYYRFKLTSWGSGGGGGGNGGGGGGGGGALSYTREWLDNYVVSNICFQSGTLVNTDQGNIPIEHLKTSINTINKKPIQYITKTFSADPKLVMVKKHALYKNIPNKDTCMSGFHKIQIDGHLIEAYKLSYINKNVRIIDNTNEPLYNILMENHEIISVQNMSVESLHPENIIAKLYKSDLPKDKKNKLIEEISIATITEDYEKYNLIKNYIL